MSPTAGGGKEMAPPAAILLAVLGVAVLVLAAIPGELDGDGDVDRDDLDILLQARGMNASGPNDPNDLDGDGIISVLDARKLAVDCTRTLCATEDDSPPVIDLNGSDDAGAGFSATFTEGGGPVSIVDTDLTVTDADMPNLDSATVTITNLLDGAGEVLNADTTGTSIAKAFAGGALTLTGPDTVANFQQVLRTVTYDNTSINPDGTDRSVSFVVTDSGFDSAPATSTVMIVGLVPLGEMLFFNETFDGNGRTCGTCHLPAGNFGLTPDSIASLPPTDPLFIAENDPVLAELEHPPLMRGPRGLILENIDGFANPPVFRNSPHFNNLNLTAPYGLSGEFPDLRVFFTGAVMQHFPKTLARVPGVDFRLPTDLELDAMEAFMLQAIPVPADQNFDLDRFVTTEQQRRGSDLFFGDAKCGQCHNGPVLAEAVPALGGGNQTFNTGVVNLPINLVNNPDNPGGGPLPREAGGLREFSTPPLFGVAQTAPFFHDNSAETLSDAVAFYDRPEFNASPAAALVGNILFTSQSQIDDIVAFLEALQESTLVVSPGSIDFGAVEVTGGMVGPVMVTVTNNAKESLTVTSRALCGGPDDGAFLVTPVGTTGVEISFDPAGLGPKEAVLEIKTDAGNRGIRLRGVGTLSGVSPFADVPVDDPSFPSVGAIFNAGLPAGCSPGLFCPDDFVTRAQVAVFLTVASGSRDVPPRGRFKDIPTNSFAAGFIERLSAARIMDGCGGGNFCPDAFVTRAELAVFLAKALGLAPVNPPTGIFADVPTGHLAAGSIERLLLDGIAAGCGGGKFCPNGLATRLEAAILITAGSGLTLP